MAIKSMIKTVTGTTSKAKQYHSNLDDLLVHHSAAVTLHSSATVLSPGGPVPPTNTGRTLAFSFSSPSSLSNPPIIDNTDYNLDSFVGESLLLDAFYENLLRQNASRAVRNETGKQEVNDEDEQEWPRLHFDVTKLAAVTIKPASSAVISGGTSQRFPTVTKKRIDKRDIGAAEQYNHVEPKISSHNKFEASTGISSTNRFHTDHLTTTTSSMTMPKANGQVVNRKPPNSPHTNTRLKIVKTELSTLNFRYVLLAH